MKLTKYEHSCVVLEEQGKKVVIDPGSWTSDFGGVDNVVAVVVTHVHPDHLNADHLQAILKANPEAMLCTTEDVAAEFKHPALKVVKAGDELEVASFKLTFGGDMHEVIYQTAPCQNISVMVNDVFYDPGDSYTMPDKPVKVLAVPTNAPWMKAADSMEYIAKVKPEQCLPIHNGLLSANGQMVYYIWLGKACEDAGVTFEALEPGQSIEI